MNEVKKEKSCGCIIVEKGKVLLVKQTKGHWGFPNYQINGIILYFTFCLYSLYTQRYCCIN